MLFGIAETMEDELKNNGVSCNDYLLFLGEKSRKKIPHHQGIHEELMEVWG